MPDSLNSDNDIYRKLRQILPPNLATKSDELIGILKNALAEQNAEVDNADTTNLSQVLQFLLGRHISTPDSIVTFGENNNIGDISIGDIANGNIVKINVILENNRKPTVNMKYFKDGEHHHQLRLITIHRRRLQVLEEQAAIFGNSCPPHILIEIEDINSEISKIINEIS